MTLADAERRAEKISTMDYVTVGEKQKFFRGSASSIADIWRHRELLGLLVRREIKARYKDSSLGIVWSLLRPLVQLAIYYFAVGQILGAARSVPDFAIFIFIGITMWGLFNEILNNSTTSILNNSGLVKKVYLPREIFPFSTVGGALFNFAMQVIVLLAAILVLSTFPLGPNLLLAPLAILSLVAFATAIGLVLSAVNVYFRDVQHLVEIATIILFWASPIVYSFTFVHKALNGNWLEQVYLMNPVTTAVLGMQKALWAEGSTATGALEQYWPPNLELRLVVTFLVSLVLLWLAQRIFARLQGNFAQEL
ncbi:sugar ABC transporter [Agreia sp. Leaf335]|uniref:ABC transporter permease n=1 Tax=Agreia sp. Leaf335 TaxID=1736340 RepID=UPI0006F376EB|nr:ABC transporter permease [Agreia sp. Leaf335]KQR24285.1 sugar ABC transporter [Agreia sp. Leaf335]